jgi:hypothetical protein
VYSFISYGSSAKIYWLTFRCKTGQDDFIQKQQVNGGMIDFEDNEYTDST